VITLARPHPQARRFVPEVVQTSAMDCGPAALQALVAGFGLSASYGRLREACQTSVDGTSITTIDEIAGFLGLDTEEMMVPIDHLLLPAARALPAIVVVRIPNGNNHFVVVWSVAGPWVQVMDPAEGRHWMHRSALLEQLYVHQADVPASAWLSWAGEGEFLATLDARLAALDIARADRDRLCAAALASPDWEALAALDAATRMTASMVSSGAVSPGPVCLSLVERQIDRSGDGAYPLLAGEYRSVWRSPARGDEETLRMRGAVLVRARGRLSADRPTSTVAALPAELAPTLNDESVRPWRTLLGMLVEDGIAAPAVLGVVLFVSAALVTANAVLLRGIVDLGQELALPSQRAGAIAAVLGFLALGLVVEIPLVAGALRMGRALDLRLRMAFLAKIPRLDDPYFRSRLLSDMAERGHSLHQIRGLPLLGVRMLSASAQLLLTVAGIAWLHPASAPLALAAAALCIGVPLACQPLMAERDLRLRSHAGALGRFYLDALLGLLPIRVHGARAAMQHQQEGLLAQWARAGLKLHAASTLVEGALALCGLGMAVLMVWSASSSTGGLLLLVYWALGMPSLGQEIAIVARQYPVVRNVVLRLFEPLGTPEPGEPATDPLPTDREQDAASIRISAVSVEAAGNTLLEGIDVTVAPGEHVAVVGRSGAGKSTLVGLLLGWHRPARGTVEVDGRPLIGDALSALRRDTAWVDPSVTLWNRSFLDNLRYGADQSGELPLADILSRAHLRDVLERLPDGLATELGEGGALVSGGEGQRTRVGRALARERARLVVLDEPFRGLDLATRRELLAMATRWWRHATLLWVTHDISETAQFGRVLVVDSGRIVEDGDPAELAGRPGSRYAALLRGDREMHEREWSGTRWRRVWIERGRVREERAP
jgi:ABC-type bacteriocin/lantibiotic exporter with double-glycine peptidase domain